MKVSELNTIIENILSEEVKRTILNESKGKSKEVFHIICDGEPYMNCDSQNEAEEHLDKLKKEHPGKQFIIEKTMYESHEDMLHKLDEMGEKLEEKENTNMENQEPMEGNSFGQAVLNAKEKGEKTFEFDGKQHDVEECWKQLEEEEMVGTMEEEEEEECKECGQPMEEEGVDFEKILRGKKDNIKENIQGQKGRYDNYDDTMDEVKNKVHQWLENGKISETEHYEMMFRIDTEDLEWPNSIGVDETKEILIGLAKQCAPHLLKKKKVEKLTSFDSDEHDLNEYKKTCEKCGKEICECGGGMYESKKKTIRLSETELTNLIAKMVSESVPGLDVTKKSHTESGKENSSHLNDVDKKMKDYLSFDGNDNPEFPKAIGKGEKVARKNTEKQEDEIKKNFAGLENLDYDIEPDENFKKRLKMAIDGDRLMGNAPTTEKTNVVPSNGSKLGEEPKDKDGNSIPTPETAKKIEKQVKDRGEDKKNRVLYKKEKVPVSESKTKLNSVLLEEINKMKKISEYNKKTQ